MSKPTNRETAQGAAISLLEGFASLANELFDAEAGKRLLDPGRDSAEPDKLRYPDQTQLVPLVADLADFAWEGTWHSDDASLLDAFHLAGPLNELLVAGLILPDGIPIFPNENRDTLQSVMAAATARYALLEGDDLTFDQLAALARVAEKTVRMAANPKIKNALRTESGPGNRTYIKADNALQWLRRRKDFKETRLNVNIGDQQAIRSPRDLAQMCSLFRRKADLSLPQLRKKLGWSASEALAYQNMEQGLLDEASVAFSSAGLVNLAHALGVPDQRKFANDAGHVIVTEKAKSDFAKRQAELDGI